jgi:hypothetical protein
MNDAVSSRRERAGIGGAIGAIAALMVALVAGLCAPSRAAAVEIVFPAGIACEFELRVEVGESSPVTKQFRDKDGIVVAELVAGKGPALVFTNGDTGATLSLKGNGSVTRTVVNADGSSTLSLMGHNVLILFPTDEPAGPSTTLIVGHALIAVDPNGNFTVHQISGATTDICATLAE